MPIPSYIVILIITSIAILKEKIVIVFCFLDFIHFNNILWGHTLKYWNFISKILLCSWFHVLPLDNLTCMGITSDQRYASEDSPLHTTAKLFFQDIVSNSFVITHTSNYYYYNLPDSMLFLLFNIRYLFVKIKQFSAKFLCY